MRYDKTKYRKHPTDDHLSDILIITNSVMELDYKIHINTMNNVINCIDPLYYG